MDNKKLNRIFLTRFALVGILFFLVLIGALGGMKNAISKRSEVLIDSQTQDYVVRMDELFSRIVNVANQSNHYVTVKKLITQELDGNQLKNNPLYPEVTKELQAIADEYLRISTAWVASANGNYYFTNEGFVSDSTWNFHEEPYYQVIYNHRNTFFCEPYYSARLGKDQVSFINPLWGEDGRLIGAFGLDLNLKTFDAFVASIHPGNDARILFISEEGKMITQNGGQEAFAPVVGSALPTEIQSLVARGDEGVARGLLDGEEVIACVRGTVIPGWRVLTVSANAVYQQHARNYYGVLFGLVLLLILLSFAASCIWLFMARAVQLKEKELLDRDIMTGLDNFTGFEPKATKAIQRKHEHKKPFAVLMKARKMSLLNEMMGRTTVDALLCHMAECLQSRCSALEPCFRSDETCLGALFFCADAQECEQRLKELDEQISTFAQTKSVGFSVQVSYGCYEIVDQHTDIETIRQRLLMVLSRKDTIKTYESTFTVYDEDLKERLQREKELENASDQALKNGEFVFYLQGKFDPVDGKIVAAEALVRWEHPEKGLLPPNSFIPLFESNGFITQLDFYVLEQVCRQLRRWIDNGTQPIQIAVNLSRNHLDNPNFTQDILDTIDRYQVPHAFIELEITESTIGKGTDLLVQAIQELRSYGLAIAIDDFGTGYSTLNTLKLLLVDTLKFDREFFVDMEENERGREVAKSIISMAKNLNLKTVAEGIETQSQVEFLLGENIDLIQGFFYSKPIQVEEFEHYLKQNQVMEQNSPKLALKS